MKIKVGDKIHGGALLTDLPIMVILTEQDKVNIANMPKECMRYAQFPASFDHAKIKKWMDEA